VSFDPLMIVQAWIVPLGGLVGVAWLAYMVIMVILTRRREQSVEALRRDVAELRGLLLGRRR
jgi:hypothetical protein